MIDRYIIMDLDGVAYDFTKAFRQKALAEGVGPANPPPVTHWDFYRDYHLNGAEFSQLLSLWAMDGLFSMIPPEPDVIEHWQAIKELPNTYFHIITSRPKSATGSTQDWLKFWGLGYDRLDVIAPGNSKAEHVNDELLSEASYTLAIDDHLEQIDNYNGHCDNLFTTVYDQPWNRDEKVFNVRAFSWKELYDMIEDKA